MEVVEVLLWAYQPMAGVTLLRLDEQVALGKNLEAIRARAPASTLRQGFDHE